MATVAEVLVETLVRTGVRRVLGVVGDSLNGITEVIRKRDDIEWVTVRHEEVAAFAAGGEAQVTGTLAVCAGSCGPGHVHLVNGLYDCHRSRVPVLAIAAPIPSGEIGSGYFQETRPELLFRDCSAYCETISQPSQAPRIVEIAIQTALGTDGVAVVILSGDVASMRAAADAPRVALRRATPIVRPSDAELDALAEGLDGARNVTILAGAGWVGAHNALMAVADRLAAPIVHTLRGKEFVEHDNPFDVGLTGLLGFASGYQAMETCDALLMLGTDFPYQQFYPEKAWTAQVDVRPGQLGRRTRLDLGLVGDVRETLPALLPRLAARDDRDHLGDSLRRYRETREQLDRLAGDGGLAMLLGDLLTLVQHRLPMKTVVYNNGSFAFVELEMKAAGILPYGTELVNPDFAAVAEAMGIRGIRVEDPGNLDGALREALAHDGPALVDVVVNRQELSLPPTITREQVGGFSLYLAKAVLSGRADEVIDLARTNVFR